MALVIEPQDPTAPEVVGLLEAHLSLMQTTSPPGHVHALDIEGLTQPDITFFAARSDTRLLGVGAVRDLGAGHGEIKSMHTAEAARGMGVGRALVEHLVSLAAERGWQRLSLETGTMHTFAPARRLYESVGFSECEPFGGYTANEYSLCMTMDLTETVG